MGNEFVGFFVVVGAAFGYGSFYVPVRSCAIYDGLIFNWYQSMGLLIAGITFALLHNNWLAPTGLSPAFYVHAEGLISGLIYQAGNVLATQAVNKVGLGIYYTVHEFTNVGATLIIGILGPRFSIPVSVPSNVGLAILGAFFIGLGTIPTMFMHDTSARSTSSFLDIEAESESREVQPQSTSISTDKVSGLVLSLVAGGFWGTMFASMPIWKARMKAAGQEADPANFVFAVCVGSAFSSTLWLLFWTLLKKLRNQPPVQKCALWPAMGAGMIFYAAMLLEFCAIALLPYAVAYTGCTGLSLAASMSWGIFAFGEMRGKHNRVMALLSFLGVVFGAALLAVAT